MKWKDVAYSRTLHTFVILVISIIAGTWLAPHYEFSQETLPWLTSNRTSIRCYDCNLSHCWIIPIKNHIRKY